MALAQWLASNGWNISKAVGMSVSRLIYRKTMVTILCAHLLLSPPSGWVCPLLLYVTSMGQRTEGSHWPAAIKTALILHISDLEKLLQPASLQMKTLSQVLSHLQMFERLKDSSQPNHNRPPTHRTSKAGWGSKMACDTLDTVPEGKGTNNTE